MDYIELLQRLAVALSIGLLIGIERGWAMLGEAEGERTAGLRTLALTGLLGGVCGVIAVKMPGGGALLAAAFLSYAAIFAAYRYREVEHRKTYGTTTIIAALVTFALGAMAIVVEPVVAAAAAVAAASLLAMKQALHGWLKTLTWDELRSALILLAMSVILLPVLPDRGFGPYEALNPYDLWRMTILIAAVSALGYLAMKWVGGGQGVALSGIAGGLVSSTAVTLSFSRMAREHPERANVLIAGALLAGAVMLARVLLVASTVQPELLERLLLPLGFAALVVGAYAAYLMWSDRRAALDAPVALKSPFELATVLKFGAFLAAVMLLARVLTHWAGAKGAYVLAAASGIADVDAVTLTLSNLAGKSIEAEVAANAILLTAAVNSISKALLAQTAGGRRPGRHLGIGAALAIVAGLAGIAVGRLVDFTALFSA